MASSLEQCAGDVRDALEGRYGRPRPTRWDLDPFEALIATLLDRALDGPKILAAVDALREGGLLDPQTLAESDPSELGEALRSAGLKVADKALLPLRRLARWLVEVYHGDADVLADPGGPVSTGQLREELVAISGVGPTTADELLLMALRRPVYPVDRATYRIFVRHGWLDATADYEEARERLERLAPDDAASLASLKLAFERVGRDACWSTVAKCDRCPLRPFLPEGGPIDPRE